MARACRGDDSGVGCAASLRSQARSVTWLGALILTGGLLWASTGVAQESPDQEGHFKVTDPAGLSGEDAEEVYRKIARDMIRGYALSGQGEVKSYRGWKRFNRYPYRSAQHGERFVNNFANKPGEGFGDPDNAGIFTPGTILVKESFSVTGTGAVFSGPLFIMEKMPRGFLAASRDWRYSMIMPDGSLFGMTKGDGDANVNFCIACHEMVGASQDAVFFVPEDHRN